MKINIILVKKMHLEKCAGFMVDGEGLLMSSDILRVLFDLTECSKCATGDLPTVGESGANGTLFF
jgi:hypothetical protein